MTVPRADFPQEQYFRSTPLFASGQLAGRPPHMLRRTLIATAHTNHRYPNNVIRLNTDSTSTFPYSYAVHANNGLTNFRLTPIPVIYNNALTFSDLSIDKRDNLLLLRIYKLSQQLLQPCSNRNYEGESCRLEKEKHVSYHFFSKCILLVNQ